MMISLRTLLGVVIILVLIACCFLSQYGLHFELASQESAPQENNVISMSIWGDSSRLLWGAIRNAELVQTYFPGWTLRVYLEPLSAHPRWGHTPRLAIAMLKDLGVELQYIEPARTSLHPNMWRFFIADDFSVDHFIVRNTESRLTARDAAAVRMWIQSGKPFHCQRDHPIHGDWAILEGMWGAKPAALHEIMERNFSDIMSSYKTDDPNFLSQHVWPRVKDHAYCSDSQTCQKWDGSHAYNIKRMNNEHVGGTYTEWDILLASPDISDNVKCLPKEEITEIR